MIYKFTSDVRAAGGVVVDSSGALIGVSVQGPSYGCKAVVYGCGFVFKLTKRRTGWKETTLHVFKGGSDGAFPSGGLSLFNGTAYGVTRGAGTGTCPRAKYGCGTVYKVSTQSGHYSNLHSFDGSTEGNTPSGKLVAVNGKLFGVAEFGGPAECYDNRGCGVLYSMTVDGSNYTVVHNFGGAKKADGASPQTGLTSYREKLYGTTTAGGDERCQGAVSNGCGTVFSTDISGRDYHVLFKFGPASSTTGQYPSSLQPSQTGTLLGTTMLGGDIHPSNCGYGCGTIFALEPSTRRFSVVHKFKSGFEYDGNMPQDLTFLNGTSLTLTSTGVLYGTTYYGTENKPARGFGTVFTVSAP